MKAFDALKNRIRIGTPPSREQTFDTTGRPADSVSRRVKTGRTEQLNVRVTAAFKKRVDQLAAERRHTIGGILEEMLKSFESGASEPQHGVPLPEARAGRTRQLRMWATDAVFEKIGKIAAERGMSVSALIEDLLAYEAARLDPQGTRLGIIMRD
jgi:hypothetical protein